MTAAQPSSLEVQVLIIEDNPDHRMLLMRLLSDSTQPRFVITEAGTLEAGCAKLRTAKYDVVMLDLSLPDSQGIGTFERANAVADETPIVVLSGLPDVSLAIQTVQMGAQDYLVKGHVDNHLVLRSIQYAVERKRAQLALRRANDELEARVLQRTNELSQVNAKLRQEVAERKRAEEQTLDSNRQLMKALDALHAMQRDLVRRERFQALAQMANGIAHEFNNVLTPIVGFSEALLVDPAVAEAPPQVREHLERIKSAALSGSKAVARVRDFAKAETGEFGPVVVRDLIQSAVVLTEPKWRDEALAAGVTIAIAQEVGDVPEIEGDAAQLRESLAHLIFNAAQAIDRRGLIQIGAESRSGGVLLFVHDDGCGMSEAQREHCLDANASGSAIDGHMTGYAVIHTIAARHGAELIIESAPGSGTKVSLVLAAATPRELAPLAAESSGAPFVRPRSLQILVVDDEPMVLEVIRLYLREDGHEVDTAVDGNEGLEKFRGGAYDLVLTDRAMPELSGDQLAAQVKAIRPGVPVILLTGFGDLMNAEGEKPAGVDVVVAKPFTMASLRKAVVDAGATLSPVT